MKLTLYTQSFRNNKRVMERNSAFYTLVSEHFIHGPFDVQTKSWRISSHNKRGLFLYQQWSEHTCTALNIIWVRNSVSATNWNITILRQKWPINFSKGQITIFFVKEKKYIFSKTVINDYYTLFLFVYRCAFFPNFSIRITSLCKSI